MRRVRARTGLDGHSVGMHHLADSWLLQLWTPSADPLPSQLNFSTPLAPVYVDLPCATSTRRRYT